MFDVFDYLTYRDALRGWLDTSSRRSQTVLARRAGVSRSMVAMILAEERVIQLASLSAWVNALGLQDDGVAYFAALVQADAQTSATHRRLAAVQARALRDAHRATRPTDDVVALLTIWYVPVVLELVKTQGFCWDPEWIAGKIWPTVEPAELADTMKSLTSLGIVTWDGEEATVDTVPLATAMQLPEAVSHVAKVYHREQLEHAIKAVEELPPEARHFGSMTVAIAPDALPALRDALHRFQLEVVEPHRAQELAGDVVQVSVQLFRRTPSALG